MYKYICIRFIENEYYCIKQTSDKSYYYIINHFIHYNSIFIILLKIQTHTKIKLFCLFSLLFLNVSQVIFKQYFLCDFINISFTLNLLKFLTLERSYKFVVYL
jgi:hypothetical protein